MTQIPDMSNQIVVVFTTSQPLTKQQLEFYRKEFDKVIQGSIPCEDDFAFSDVPEFTSDCSVVQTEEITLLDIFKDLLHRMNPWRGIIPVSVVQ